VLEFALIVSHERFQSLDRSAVHVLIGEPGELYIEFAGFVSV
jgi:hypothetical protein